MKQHDEARRQFEAAARELVEANKRARVAGKYVSDELLAAAQRLNEAHSGRESGSLVTVQ